MEGEQLEGDHRDYPLQAVDGVRHTHDLGAKQPHILIPLVTDNIGLPLQPRPAHSHQRPQRHRHTLPELAETSRQPSLTAATRT